MMMTTATTSILITRVKAIPTAGTRNDCSIVGGNEVVATVVIVVVTVGAIVVVIVGANVAAVST